MIWFFPSSYPLPNIVPNFVESFLLFVTTVTCGLNALSQLLMNGTITKPLVGHAASLMPKWDEDFSVVLFRLGTASMEATSVAGFGNEVGSISQSSGNITKAPLQPDHSSVEITRAGVVSIVHGKNIKLHRGFANEIKNVKASSRHSDAWIDTVVNATWSKELGRFLLGLWRVLLGSARLLWAMLRGRLKHQQLGVHTAANDNVGVEYALESPENGAEPEEDMYERFLRGDDLSEDEDEDDFEPETTPPGTPSATSDDEGEAEENEDSTSDALVLYADLSDSTGSSSTSVPLLLAHMTNPSTSPLTRRRYSRFVSLGQPSSSQSHIGDWNAFVQDRREAKRGAVPQEDHLLESRRSCVICTVEPRDIICWPCR